jgi:hypothetical protein
MRDIGEPLTSSEMMLGHAPVVTDLSARQPDIAALEPGWPTKSITAYAQADFRRYPWIPADVADGEFSPAL